MALLCVLCLLLLGAVPSTARDPSTRPLVLAAASLSEALREIAGFHQQTTGDRPVFSFAASSTLARQAREGVPADVFLSADEASMDLLERANLLLPGTRRALLTNSLVVAVHKDLPTPPAEPADLLLPGIRRIALGEPRSVPAGIYARQYLENVGLWAQLRPRVVPTEHVRAALAAVESGNADAAIVYATDLATARALKVAFRPDPSRVPPIRYPVAILRESSQVAAARRFLETLDSPAARRVFENHGFGVLGRASTP